MSRLWSDKGGSPSLVSRERSGEGSPPPLCVLCPLPEPRLGDTSGCRRPARVRLRSAGVWMDPALDVLLSSRQHGRGSATRGEIEKHRAGLLRGDSWKKAPGYEDGAGDGPCVSAAELSVVARHLYIKRPGFRAAGTTSSSGQEGGCRDSRQKSRKAVY